MDPVHATFAILIAGLCGALLGVLGMIRRKRGGRVTGAMPALAAAARDMALSVEPAAALPAALHGVGTALGCAHLEVHQVILPPDGGLPLTTLRHAWAASGRPDRGADPAQRDRPLHPDRSRWLSDLSAGRSLLSSLGGLPPVERQELAGNGSMAALPIQVGGRLWGYLLCLDRGASVRNGEELDALRILVDLTAAGLSCAASRIQLAAARAEAESGDRAKREFLANISHEVRTPLNGVLGMTGLLLDTTLDVRQREYAQVVRTSAENLLALLNDLLDLAKAEGDQKVERVRFDPLRLAEDVVAMLAERAHTKGVEVAVHPGESLPRRTLGDATRLRQVLVNLVGNAIKFTGRGHVLVRVDWNEDAGGSLTYAVEDTGIGIDPVAQSCLFTAFTQGDGSTTRRFGGTGLGLAICRRMTELQGGSIRCSSTPGKGSVFTVCVPSPEGSSVGAARSAMLSSRLLGAHVLVVEPCAEVRGALTAICRRVGLVPEEAPGCVEAAQRLAIVGAETPRIVLVAANTPGASDLPRTVREAGGSMVFILLAPVARRIAQAEAVRLGFAACLVKPPRAARLADAIGRAIDQADEDTSHEETGAIRRKPLKVLVVEDDAVNQLLAKAVLERDGIRVDVAGDGHEALEALARATYDAVLMDLLMPVMDGFACAREIRRLEHERNQPAIPLIAVSALDDPDVQSRCRQAGMDGSLRKPFEPRHLRRVLRTMTQEGRRAAGG